jgi:hypothetical protein
VSSQQQVELSRGLHTVRTLLVRAVSERIAVPDLHRGFKDEWNQFAASLEAVVQFDNTPNVASFCDDKLAFVCRPHAARDGNQNRREGQAKSKSQN